MAVDTLPSAAHAATGVSEEDWQRARELILRAQRILLCSHKKPDGDAIGSLLGLGYALESVGKDVTLACADKAENNLATLPGAERIVQDLASRYSVDAPLPWDLIVVMDASGLDRLGALYEEHKPLFDALPVIDVDHHVTNDRFGVANIVDATAASCTEVLTRLLGRLGITPNAASATCLLAGLMTDSLSFQTESTTPTSLRTAAELVEAGAPVAGLAQQLFRQRARSGAILWSKVLGSLQFAVDGRVAWFEIPRAAVEESGPGAESGGLSGFAGSIHGVVLGFTVEEGKDGKIYASFRSATVDCAKLASEFGGGGHVRAAGCHFDPPTTLAEARDQILPVAERYLRDLTRPSATLPSLKGRAPAASTAVRPSGSPSL